MTLQPGLASVSATKNPIPVEEWAGFVLEMAEGMKQLGATLDVHRDLLVSFELNVDFGTWFARDVGCLKLQTSPGAWAQMYNKTMPDGRRVMRVEIRESPKDLSVQRAGEAFARIGGMSLVEAAAFLRGVQGVRA